MATAYLTFGINHSGQWQSIDDAKSGRTDLVCPWCKMPLIARKGDIKAHHFAHDGETCRISDEAVRQTLIPTFDTFELLDSDERKYLERRVTYHSHKKVHHWPSMNEAIRRLEVMQLVTVESKTDHALEVARKNLSKLGNWLDSAGYPNAALQEIFNALRPLTDIDERWKRAVQIESTQIARDYNKNRIENVQTLLELEQAQRYWLDAFWRRQSLVAPDYLELLKQKIHAINQQSLYVMRITGEFNMLPSSFIKIGMSTRDADMRLKEVLACLKPFGSKIKGEALAVKPNAGRLERLLHRFFDADNLPVGSFREYFQDKRADWLIEQLDKLIVSEYRPPVTGSDDNHVSLPGRRRKSNAELLAEYHDIANALESGKGIREISRETGRSVNTIQKVKSILTAPQAAGN
ncbi:GIY-YIG nuclease family protein [Photorhabdus sp. CRCIA-P01]|uniref:GIY-YIG nuclease family protein n=1 Tax=Photorhabdus sp. CRCIA-P01 TaxID=2019570 RepID=UPI000E59C5FF|nr:competence protein CoiA family protein [Photorhabdus sp. CRCIA-P01]